MAYTGLVMSLLFKRLKIEGDRGQTELEALFDTGATYSSIRKEVAAKVATILPLPRPKVFELAEKGRRLQAKERAIVDIIVNGFTISDEVVVIEGLSEELILGASTMQKWRIKLDLERGKVIIDPRAVRLKLV